MSNYIDSLAQNVAERVVNQLVDSQVFSNQLTTAVALTLSRTRIEFPFMVWTVGAIVMTSSVMLGNYLYDLSKPKYSKR